MLLQVDSNVRYSWFMLGREPRSDKELLMVYGGILAHGRSMSAAETACMIPQVSAATIRQAMHWDGDERRLAEASAAVLAYIRQHPIAARWGRSDLASSDMMSLETQKRIWQARIDPRRQTPSLGIYGHVLAGWGIFNAQPFVLNERQVGVAIEGVLRQESVKITQLAVDTHGHTDVGMAISDGLGFAMCPRLKALSDRHLYLPRGSDVPENLKAICEASLDLSQVAAQWDAWVRLLASVYSGHISAVNLMARFGSAARGDPLYEVGVVVGRLLRTVFLADYFVNPAFRREILRVLNRGEATDALKRLIYTGRVAGHQAKSQDEMQAVADALSLLANIVMMEGDGDMNWRWTKDRLPIPAGTRLPVIDTHWQGHYWVPRSASARPAQETRRDAARPRRLIVPTPIDGGRMHVDVTRDVVDRSADGFAVDAR